jgi:hypothetical protein
MIERSQTKPCPRCGETKPKDGYKYCQGCVEERMIADRDEDGYCERMTQGCSINHTAERKADPRNSENLGCEGW